MKLKFKEMLMIGAMSNAAGIEEGYLRAVKFKDENMPELWVSLIWYDYDFKGYYLRSNSKNQELIVEWQNFNNDKDLPDKIHVITVVSTTWADTAKILVQAIKRHKKYMKDNM